eukprot:SM000047S16820  [mRNA]  locus=s47:12219:14273:- [translate_table: standard]
MSSLRNAVKRRAHKERAQPSERKRYGLLEKHKDYVLRARDYHRKEDAIRVLKEKAAFRNPDEFYFKMQSTRTEGGIHMARPDESNKYSPEELRLMKTQDYKYVQNKAQSEAKKVEKLQAALHSIGDAHQNKHVRFASTGNDAVELLSKPVEDSEDRVGSKLPSRLQRKRAAAYRELSQRRERSKKMTVLAQTMVLQKELLGKGRVRKIRSTMETEEEGSSPAKTSYRWKTERKR